MLIAGERREASSGRSFEVTNPATGEVIARVPLGDRDDLRAAVEAADGSCAGVGRHPGP